MSDIFQSSNELSRSWDDRVLQHQSLRSTLLWLLGSVFVLGIGIGIAALRAFHLHHIDWSGLLPFLALALIDFRYALALYRPAPKVRVTGVTPWKL